MKKILNYIILGVFIAAAYSCDEDATSNSVNYLTFESSPTATVDLGSGSSVTDIYVYTGNKTGSSRTFDIVVDADASTADPADYSVPSTVTVPANESSGSFPLQLNEGSLTFGGSTIVIMFTATDDEIFTNETVTVNVALACPNAESNIAFAFDGYASEIDWNITDSNDNVVLSGGGYSDGDTSAIASSCLLAGDTYTWTINDSFGDGLSFPSDGTATITYNGTVLSMASGNFGSQYVDTFTIN